MSIQHHAHQIIGLLADVRGKAGIADKIRAEAEAILAELKEVRKNPGAGKEVGGHWRNRRSTYRGGGGTLTHKKAD